MNPALLLVDLQQDYLDAPQLEPVADVLVSRATHLLNDCRKRGIPIIHIWTTIHRDNDRRMPHWRELNRWQCVSGTIGHRPPAFLEPTGTETIIHKSGFNAFADGTLETALKQIGCDTVILSGLHLHACVRAAATEAHERGYKVRIAEDAVASNDPIHATATRRWLAERSVCFLPSAAVLSDAPPTLRHFSPSNSGDKLFNITIATAEEIRSATTVANKAWTGWSQTPLSERGKILSSLADKLDSEASTLAHQMAIEIGKPISQGIEEVGRAAKNIRDVIDRAAKSPLEKKDPAGIVRHQPLGVIALVSPWNNPIAIPVGKIAPSLIFGNTVVWKPSPAASKISHRLLELMRKSGVPVDAVQMLDGDHSIAQSLAADSHIRAVTFTGSLSGGHAMQEICARRIVPLQAELNGNNASIVWDDADLEDAATQIASGAFGFAGQRCTANRRVIVPSGLFETFLALVKTAAEKMVWGDPTKKETAIGPVISAAKRDELADLIARLKGDKRIHRVETIHDAQLRQPWFASGAYAQPAIICCDEPDHSIVQEETFGPLLIIQRAESFFHAITLLNGVRHGLLAALFSHSTTLQQQFLRDAQAGMLKLNSSTAGVDVTLPFGGWKTSSLGPPEHGESDRTFYTRVQTIYGAEKLFPLNNKA